MCYQMQRKKDRKKERKKDRDAKEIQTQRLTEQARLSF